MNFLIADTFTSSLARLTGDEQKLAKTKAFDLQMNPAQPGLRLHDIEDSKDKNFKSVSVNMDLRLIVHRTEDKLLLCYVDHHQEAYRWAERRKLETHPKTGAAQFVEMRETVREIAVPRYVEQEITVPPPAQTSGPKPLLLAHVSEEDLLGYGVPPEWISEARAATEDTILELAEHLPSEAAEALLDLATGKKPQPVAVAPPEANPFEHPDAQRRFRVMANVEELERAMEYPWDKWMVFLHPAQRDVVEKDYNGPARVSGSAGTGKTIVALHRAVHLARHNPDARVLLATFSESLANALRVNLRRLLTGSPRLGERMDVDAMDAIGLRLYTAAFGKPRIASPDEVRDALAEASEEAGDTKFTLRFLTTEWEEIVDAWQLTTWEAYRDVARLGRKTRLAEKQRAELWKIFERTQKRLAAKGLITLPQLFTRLAGHFAKSKGAPHDFIVIDESQDISVAQLRFLAALGGGRPNSLFFAGDLGQRIFQPPFSWKSLGVDVRGRSRTLRINYRTSHQIRSHTDRLLQPEIADIDGNTEDRSRTVSVFNGPPPGIRTFGTIEEEIAAVSEWIGARRQEGLQPHEIAVFVRSPSEISRARQAMEAAGLSFAILDERVETASGKASISTMHLAKGLEFRAVAVMACDDEVIPSSQRIESVVDDSDLEEVYNTERHLLYVACTRARDHLLVTGVDPASEFLDDLGS